MKAKFMEKELFIDKMEILKLGFGKIINISESCDLVFFF